MSVVVPLVQARCMSVVMEPHIGYDYLYGRQVLSHGQSRSCLVLGACRSEALRRRRGGM